jgi:cytochrome c-type biogenesis protein
MSVENLVSSGPLILAIPVAAAAGALTFLSPCCLPLVPGYLSYITGMSGAGASGPGPQAAGGAADGAAVTGGGSAAVAVAEGGSGGVTTARVTAADAPGSAAAPGPGMGGLSSPPYPPGPGTRGLSSPPYPPGGRAVAGTALFVLGFSAVFAVYGLAFGGLGHLLRAHNTGFTQVLGVITILLGLMFAGAFDRFSFAGRIFRPAARPRAGLAGAPLLGVMFGFGWTPCIGPTLTAVLALSETSGTAARGAFLAFVYGLGLGIPFLIVAAAFQRAVNVLGFFRRNARLVSRIGGALLVVVGVLEVTGAWTSAIAWLHTHWLTSYSTPL